MKSGIGILSVILLFLALGGIGYIIGLFNSLIQVRNNIGKAWSNIDVLLLQRNEGIPERKDSARSALPALLNNLKSPDAHVLQTTIIALGKIGPAAKEAVPALREAMNDPSHIVREEAHEARGKIEWRGDQ